ncbi:Amino acid transporter protein [Klebsormidium nitens]|uniref:Amino acid transporter protein n=1 Tax=Klebsormidium nitens TaxID=105231 RepID=A0A1Y1IG05_KLENI|nr:Amino acid transporter protein [Klebsormidium nitens]|eukprot:GAQ87696.1 Amino acid transporter protein [Klebsormidium nitens]
MDNRSVGLSPKKDAAENERFVPYHEAPFGERLMTRGNLRLMLSAGATLTLAIMGSAVLPVSSAFASTGIICSVLLMVVVALANSYTSDMLLRQAYVAEKTDYEDLAYAVGGELWRVVTQLSIIVLMMGTLVGGIEQVGQAGSTALTNFGGDSIPTWLTDDGKGRFIMAATVLVVVFPLCLIKQLRQLEYVGWAGVAIVIWLMIAVMVDSISAGLPAVGNDLPVVGFISLSAVCGAVSTFGFAFYIQPVLMPMIAEMPRGKYGVKMLGWSNRFVVLVNAFVTYFILGFFGAARYGADTEGNILQNAWIGGGVWQGLLNVAMCLYLAVSLPPIEFPTRHTLDIWLVKLLTAVGVEDAAHRFRWGRHLTLTTLILGVALGISEAIPDNSAKVLLVTGATGVCMVSYVIPVGNHLMLYFGVARCQRRLKAELMRNLSLHGGDVSVHSQYRGHVLLKELQNLAVPLKDALPPLGPNSENGPPNVLEYRKEPSYPGVFGTLYEAVTQVGAPLLVLAVGVFCSVAALTTINTL